MSNTTLSPNMNLVVPTVGVDPGPDWANNINADLSILDGHNHSNGQGVQITPSGLNINTDLPVNGNNLTLIRSAKFQVQSAPLSGAADLGCAYVSGVDLYFNDENGNQIQITKAGGIAGTSGSIANLTSPASASYVSANQTFVWQSAASTPANLDAGSIILRNIVANSKGLTLNPPSSMAANYSLTLPAVPGSTSFMTIDSSGNMGTASSVSAAQIASASITGSQIASATITRNNIAAVGQQISASSGLYSTTSTSYVNVNNLSVTITTSGNPVMIFPQSDGTGTYSSQYSVTGGTGGQLQLLRADLAPFPISQMSVPAGGTQPVSGLMYMDTPSAGTYTYTVQAKVVGAATLFCNGIVLVAYELI